MDFKKTTGETLVVMKMPCINVNIMNKYCTIVLQHVTSAGKWIKDT
jgi:hypothetical protein